MQKIKHMVAFLLISIAMIQTIQAEVITEITGAGATFPFPIYSKWAEAYQQSSKVKLNYQSIGSGGGIKQIEAKTVDFGASDMPLKEEDLSKKGLFQFPAVIGGVVLAYNIKGIETNKLKLTGETVADIYLGNIKKWDDPKIAALNPDLKLPNKDITVVYRSDGPGTTFLFTDYLSKVSADWKSKVGSSTSVQWPAGVGGKGNEGVAGFTKQIDGSIGYVEYAYAKQNKLATAALKNKEGHFLTPSIEVFQAAASKAEWEKTKNLYIILTDQAGEKSWPITGATYILLHKVSQKPDHTAAVLKFFQWSHANGDNMARDLDYVPLPQNLKTLIEKEWVKEAKAMDGKQIWK